MPQHRDLGFQLCLRAEGRRAHMAKPEELEHLALP
jgi:hypothetical protein